MLTPDVLFTILSDSTRLRIMMLIAREGELCVCELMSALNESQPKISRHLAAMRNAGCVSARREGTWMHYRLDPDLPDWAVKIIAGTCRQIRDQKPFDGDYRKLSGANRRPGSRCA